MITVGDSEIGLARELAEPLRGMIPQTEGYAIRVEMRENGRKKRKNASQQSWHPGSGEIVIKFDGPAVVQMPPENDSQADRQSTDKNPQGGLVSEIWSSPESRSVDFIKSLDAAERRPGFEFVALKWFRDLFLAAENYEWTASYETRDQVLRTAVSKGVAITYKVPNPKTPAFPVTAIRLNRHHPDVVTALGEDRIPEPEFQPIDISGETLSSTVLQERR